jgi:sortase A
MKKFWNKKNIQTIALIIVFLIGLAVLLYPTISDKWNRYRDSLLVSSYDEAVSQLDEEDYQEVIEAAREYNANLTSSSVPDAFSVRENRRDEEYESLLNVNGDGMMGYVSIPEIDIQLPIYHYTSDDILEKGAGHLPGSSLPVGGENTHAVISAHRGLPSQKMFTDLDKLQLGDAFYIKVYNTTLAYEVDQILTVEPDQTDELAIQSGEDYVTLVTCTPYAVNTQRLLVRGHRIPYDEETYEAAMDNAGSSLGFDWSKVICTLIGVAAALILVGIIKRREIMHLWKTRKERKS